MQVQSGENPREPQRERSALLRFGGMGTEFAFGLVGLLLLGMWIDQRWSISPRGAITGVVIGIIGGGYNFIRQARKLMREQEALQRERFPNPGPPGTGDDRATDESQPHE